MSFFHFLGDLLQAAYEDAERLFSEAEVVATEVECAVEAGARAGGVWAKEHWKVYIYTRSYNKYDGQRYRVCTCHGTTKVETLRFDKPSGKYYATGLLPDPPYRKGDHEPEPMVPHHPEILVDPLPELTHLNGMLVDPAQGIEAARVLSRDVSDFPGCGDGHGCGCVLFTYSETLGWAGDLAESVAAKAGRRDTVTAIQEADMRRAIEEPDSSPHPLIISAHSRGSIHTDNAWKNVRDEVAQKYYSDDPAKYDDDPEAVRAQKDAVAERQLLNEIDPKSALSPERAGTIAREQKARELAKNDANKTMNENTHVITSGNAVYFPDQGQDLTNLYMKLDKAPWYLPFRKSKDRVPFLVGHTRDSRPLEVDATSTKHAQQVADSDPIGDELGNSAYHRFNQWYSPAVAEEYCKRKSAKTQGP